MDQATAPAAFRIEEQRPHPTTLEEQHAGIDRRHAEPHRDHQQRLEHALLAQVDQHETEKDQDNSSDQNPRLGRRRSDRVAFRKNKTGSSKSKSPVPRQRRGWKAAVYRREAREGACDACSLARICAVQPTGRGASLIRKMRRRAPSASGLSCVTASSSSAHAMTTSRRRPRSIISISFSNA